MNKKQILLLLLVLILTTAGFGAFRLFTLRESARKSITLFPDLDVTNLKGDSLKLGSLLDHDKASLILYFDSKCGKCRDMLSELDKLADKLPLFNVVLLSAEELRELNSLQTKLNRPEVQLLQVDPRQFFRRFGSLRTPQVFTYSKDRRLLSDFNSQATLDQIFATLKP